MRARQEAAVRHLEEAFERCRRNGLVFMGMDGSLLAYDGEELRGAERERGSLYEAQRALEQGQSVDTHGCYLDSGGW